jgi:hypothetical protein
MAIISAAGGDPLEGGGLWSFKSSQHPLITIFLVIPPSSTKADGIPPK